MAGPSGSVREASSSGEDPAALSWRERRNVLLWCAPLILIFAVADGLTPGTRVALTFAVRVAWAGTVVAVALWLPRATPLLQERLVLAVGLSTPVFFGLLVHLTGGTHSPLFHFMLAMPLVVAVVLQDHPIATLGAAVGMVLAGVAVQVASGREARTLVEWLVLATCMAALAVYASVIYRRLRNREALLYRQHVASLERERDYQVAVEARDHFLSVASHELRTPLTALKLQAQHARRTVTPGSVPEKAERALNAVLRQAERLQSLMDRLLDLSVITAGRMVLDPVDADLSVLVQETVTRLREEHGDDVDIQVHSPGPVLGRWDAVALQQVVQNLLGNAVKYGDGKPVVVRVVEVGEQVHVEVEDHGIGISAQDLPRIFQRFERAASARNYGGLGLGLWLSRQIVRQMGGDITVESAVGSGSTFTVVVPRRLGAREVPERSVKPEVPLH
ncbi:MAG: HAMP domain-containing sensor histidine kinase [Myxococcota bacterium]